MDCGANCARYLLFIFNLIFFLLGVAVAIIGALLLATDHVKHTRETLDDLGNYQTLAIALIILGVIVAILAFWGCCGAIRKSYCMLVTFAVLIFILVVAQVVVGVVAILNKDKTGDEIREAAYKSLARTGGPDQTFSRVWNETQREFKCCGVNNSMDWVNTNGTKYFHHQQPPFFPDSCCKEYAEGCADTRDVEAFDNGCLGEIEKEFKDSLFKIGLIAIIIGLVEIIGILFAWCVATQVKREERAGY